MVALLTVVAMLVSGAPTAAAWTDREYGRGSFTAGTLSPPTGLVCTGGVGRFDLRWTLPAGGVHRAGYTWTVTPNGALGPTGSGTIADPATTTLALTGGGLLTLGTGTFQLRATGPGNWTSTPVTATLTVVLGLIATCTVP